VRECNPTLDDDLVKRVRRIAAERDTTLTAMIREHLEQVTAADAASGRRRRQRETLGLQKFPLSGRPADLDAAGSA
jgi:hypothetical protein